MPDNQENAGGLGRFLAAQLTPERLRTWRIVFFLALAVVAALNLVITTHEPHFGVDAYRLFWPAFGLVTGVVMVFLVKKIIQPLIKRPEDHYGDV
jgi:antibiotic biosynthesis monooxygenase (ABM) superfamily enzyme